MLAPGEWALVLPPGPGLPPPRVLRPLARDLVSRFPAPGADGEPGLAVVRVPGPCIDDRLGLALLHYRGGRTAAYCPADLAAAGAAARLSALAGAARLFSEGDGRRVTVSVVSHEGSPGFPCPAAAAAGPPGPSGEARFYVCHECARLSPELADVLGVLCTAQCGWLGWQRDGA